MDAKDRSEIPRGDASKINCAAAPVSMTKDDMRNLYRILQNAVNSVVGEDHPDVREKVHVEVTRAFEMARHAVRIDGRVVVDGQEFKQSCESTVGIEPLDEELQREIAALHGDIHKELGELMSLRQKVPLKLRRNLGKVPINYHEVQIEVQEQKFNQELISQAKQSLKGLDALEARVESLKAKRRALDYTL